MNLEYTNVLIEIITRKNVDSTAFEIDKKD